MAGQISKITQIGMVTADLDKMVKYYEEMLGVGPWTVVADTKKGIGAPATNTKVNGKRVDFDVKVAICMLDGFELEIIQPMGDKSIYAEHLKKHGEGVINHIAIVTPDNAKFREVMKANGIKSCQKGDVDPALGQSWDYYDGSQYFGTIFELHDKNPVPDDED